MLKGAPVMAKELGLSNLLSATVGWAALKAKRRHLQVISGKAGPVPQKADKKWMAKIAEMLKDYERHPAPYDLTSLLRMCTKNVHLV